MIKKQKHAILPDRLTTYGTLLMATFRLQARFRRGSDYILSSLRITHTPHFCVYLRPFYLRVRQLTVILSHLSDQSGSQEL